MRFVLKLTLPALGIFSTLGAAEAGEGAAEGGLFDADLPAAIHATRLDYSEFDAPEAVTLVTQEDIRLAGYLEVSEIFRSVSGFRIVKIGDESRLSYHGTTVIQNRRMRVTIDGQSVLIGTGEYVEFDKLPIDLEDIARVTITRGTTGAAWGDNAFLASVDFETTGRDHPRGISLRAGGGSNNREKFGLSVHERLGDFDLAFSGGSERDGGYDYADAENTPRDDGKEIHRARLSVDRQLTDRSRWRLDASMYETENRTGIRQLRLSGDQDNDGAFIALSNQREFGDSARLDWFINHSRQRELVRQVGCYTPETIAGAMAVVTDPEHLAGLLAPTLFVPVLLGIPLSDTCFWTDLGVDAQRTELELQYEARQGRWRYLFGAAAADTEASSAEWFAGMDQRLRSYRVFGESAVSLGRLHSSIGVMSQDASNVSDSEWAWRGALNWQLAQNQMIRYSYAHSFRTPSLVETETYWTSTYHFGRRGDPLDQYLFSLSSPVNTSSNIVEPESIESHAIGFFGTFLQSRLTTDVKFFRERIRDPVEASVIHFSPPPFNSSPFALSGVEAEFTFRATDRWRISGQYSYLDNDSRNSFELGLQGNHGSSLTTSYRLTDRHAFTLSYYGNSTISGHSYDRYDAVYNYQRQVGPSYMFRSQLVFQHHIGGADGLYGDVPFTSNEGYFDKLNQVYLFLELTF